MTSWLDGALPPDHHGLRLYCFPHAGGGGRFFHPWRRPLAPDVAVRPVVPPGREGRFQEAPYDRMEPLVKDLVDALRPGLDAPFAFFGHSLGAAVAYEAVLRLRELGLPQPFCLFVSGRRAPQVPNPPPYLHLLDDQRFAEEIVRLDGTPATLLERPRVLRFLLPTLRADYTLHEVYEPTPATPLDIPVFGYVGDDDPLASPADVAAWCQATTGPFTSRVFSGGHFYLKDRQEQVLDVLRSDLSSVRVGSGR